MGQRHTVKGSYDPRNYERNFSNCVEKPEKFRSDFSTQLQKLLS